MTKPRAPGERSHDRTRVWGGHNGIRVVRLRTGWYEIVAPAPSHMGLTSYGLAKDLKVAIAQAKKLTRKKAVDAGARKR